MKSSLIRHWGFVLLAISLSSLVLPSAMAAEKPNVLFIFIDDQGYYDLGCYGATEVKTPRIDALAKEGVRFTDFYSAAPICSPSRAALITGCYPRRTGNHIWVHRPDAEDGIPTESLTIAVIAPAPSSSYYLVVPRNLMREGSYGVDGSNVQRPAALAGCLPQLLGSCSF